MGIFDVNYTQQAPELLPPDKRDAPRLALISSLLSGVQWCRDLILGSYKTGSGAPDYAAGTYPEYAQVVYQKSVYYSLVDGNTADPSDTTTWLKVQDNFLGVGERVKFNGQNIILEYALNQRFDGVFRPPGSASMSDIYMTNIAAVIAGFNVGETTGSSVGQTTSSDTVGLPTPFLQVNNFEVMVKASVFADTNTEEISNFIRLYLPASLNFIVSTY